MSQSPGAGSRGGEGFLKEVLSQGDLIENLVLPTTFLQLMRPLETGNVSDRQVIVIGVVVTCDVVL